MKCTQCKKEIEQGFLCEDRWLFLCKDCQKGWKMAECPHDSKGEHFHIEIPGWRDQNKDTPHP